MNTVFDKSLQPIVRDLSSLALPATATPAYRTVSRDTATQNTVDVQVGQGRSTATDFSQINERIIHMLLTELSRVAV